VERLLTVVTAALVPSAEPSPKVRAELPAARRPEPNTVNWFAPVMASM
jgi:hypothetical protein